MHLRKVRKEAVAIVEMDGSLEIVVSVSGHSTYILVIVRTLPIFFCKRWKSVESIEAENAALMIHWFENGTALRERHQAAAEKHPTLDDAPLDVKNLLEEFVPR